MMRIALFAVPFAAIVATLAPQPAVASEEDKRLVTRGFALVQRDCGPCHATGQRDQSPHRIATPLRSLHTRYPIAMLADGRQSHSIAGHDEMPGFDYTREDMRALLLYIDSLSPLDRRYLAAP